MLAPAGTLMFRSLIRLAATLCLLTIGARADTLPLPSSLVALTSDQGEQYLLESGVVGAYVPISVNFVTQKTQAYCGVASMVMVLNALRVPAPTSPEYQPYATFTQDNILDDRSDRILPRQTLDRQGMTLDQLGQLLTLHPVAVAVHHAADGGLEAFRSAARAALAAKDQFVIVNYLRKTIGQERGGHISPLAAYDAKADRFLILDVARYKYPPVWVQASDIFDAMNTTDAANDDKTRGFVIATPTAAAGEAAQ
jgi:hypothetical protein